MSAKEVLAKAKYALSLEVILLPEEINAIRNIL